MRETVTDYEVKTVEKEIEIVYCDICDSQCTDTHEVVPQELCPNCQPDEDERGWSMSEYRDVFEKHETSDNIRMGKNNAILFTLLFPLFFSAALLDAIDDPYDNAARWFVIGALGFLLWSGLVWGIMVLV